MTSPPTVTRRDRPVPSEASPGTLGILLLSGGHERAHYAFVLATGAAAIGREVVLFATNAGCLALTGALDGDPREALAADRGVAGLAELRAAARELGVRLIACETGLRMTDIDAAALAPGVEVSGVVTFLSAVGAGSIVSL